MDSKSEIDIDLDDPRASRSYRLKPPRHFGVKLGRIFADKAERFIANRGSIEDHAIYDTGIFPWVQKIEQGWKEIRSELDEVMAFRNEIPSFHEILKEASAITQDQDWKTFFLVAP